MKKILLICLLSSICIYGCGSPDGSLTTSSVTAKVDTPILDADVAKWTDATACTGGSIPAADSVNVTVSSKAYSNTGSMGLAVRIDAATIIYTPANSATPAMASEYQILGMIIDNGGSATIPVRVVTQEQKIHLQTALACNTPIYNYYTKIIMDITEIGTGKKSTIDAAVQLRLADFID